MLLFDKEAEMDLKEEFYRIFKVKPIDDDPLTLDEIFCNLGVFFLQAKELNLAIKILEFATKRFPEYAVPFLNLHAIYNGMAEKNLNKAKGCPDDERVPKECLKPSTTQ